MIRKRRLLLGLLTLTVVGVAGCTDTTGPEGDLGGLDPIAVSNELNQLLVPLQWTSEVSVNMDQAFDALREAGVVFEEAAPVSGLASVQFPAELLGTTWVYATELGEWVVDESLEGAPTDGVRVLFYDVDGNTGFFTIPLVALGHVDLTAETDTEGREWLVMAAVYYVEGAPDEFLLQLAQWYREEGVDGDTTEQFIVDGVYADDERDVAVYMESNAARVAGDESNQYEVTLGDGALSYEFYSDETVEGDTVVVNEVDATAVVSGGTIVLDLRLERPAGRSTYDADGTVTLNGEVVARLTSEDGQRFVGADGERLSSAQEGELNIMLSIFLTNLPGYPLYELPLYFGP